MSEKRYYRVRDGERIHHYDKYLARDGTLQKVSNWGPNIIVGKDAVAVYRPASWYQPDDCVMADFRTAAKETHDPVNHPSHYTGHPSGIECIQITEHMGFNLGNAVKYIWRADLKNDAIEDLKKAQWYIERELQKREK